MPTRGKLTAKEERALRRLGREMEALHKAKQAEFREAGHSARWRQLHAAEEKLVEAMNAVSTVSILIRPRRTRGRA